VLQATKVSKYFDHSIAVRGVSLEVRPGEVVGLVGESGSGKSTLLSLLAGLHDPDEGTVLFQGERVLGPSQQLVPGHPQIKLVHQEYQLQPNITIRENIAFALRYYEKSFRDYRVDQLLKWCRLESVAGRQPRTVSGGEKQRAAIARALAEKPADDHPAVLLLDEPFSHLDLPNRILVRDLLLDLVEHEQTGCLFVTHDATDALAISSRIGILQAGRMIQLDTPRNVYHRPVNTYAARMTGPANLIRAKHLHLLGVQTAYHPNAVALIRPEHVRLTEEGPFTGTVRRVFFRGAGADVELVLSRYVSLIIHADGNTELATGQAVRFDLLPGAVHWLKE